MNIQPLADRVVVKPLKVEEKTKGGIVIPETAKEKPQQGEVVAVGSGRTVGEKKIPLEVKTGDKVIYGKYSGTEISGDDDQGYLVLKEDEILAVVK